MWKWWATTHHDGCSECGIIAKIHDFPLAQHGAEYEGWLDIGQNFGTCDGVSIHVNFQYNWDTSTFERYQVYDELAPDDIFYNVDRNVPAMPSYVPPIIHNMRGKTSTLEITIRCSGSTARDAHCDVSCPNCTGDQLIADQDLTTTVAQSIVASLIPIRLNGYKMDMIRGVDNGMQWLTIWRPHDTIILYFASSTLLSPMEGPPQPTRSGYTLGHAPFTHLAAEWLRSSGGVGPSGIPSSIHTDFRNGSSN